jgi:putative ubiquitin-RnfH superfamily antitoxin RatB of RatAB toxin-antitoxin module
VNAATEINIEVAYVSKDRQFYKALLVPAGTRLLESLSLSGLLTVCPELDSAAIVAGIYGKKADNDQVLREGDRVEVYRPLEIDPKQARRERAARNKR